MSYKSRSSHGYGPRNYNEGDWICSDTSCSNVNFARRVACNLCGRDRYSERSTHSSASSSKKSLSHEIGKHAAEKSKGLFSADDWQCTKCGNVNWARRTQCNMCNAPKFTDNEERTGLGGGYNDRDQVEYVRRDDSDSEYDDFGRLRKKRKVLRESSDWGRIREKSSERSSERTRDRSRDRSRDRRSRETRDRSRERSSRYQRERSRSKDRTNDRNRSKRRDSRNFVKEKSKDDAKGHHSRNHSKERSSRPSSTSHSKQKDSQRSEDRLPHSSNYRVKRENKNSDGGDKETTIDRNERDRDYNFNGDEELDFEEDEPEEETKKSPIADFDDEEEFEADLSLYDLSDFAGESKE